MPSLDDETGNLIIRIVYDGTPYAGKTTSLAALAARVGSTMVKPATYDDGRTLFFDWVHVVGGMFDGQPIFCEVLAVPGQRALGSRRRELIETADAVVSVVDIRKKQFARSLRYFRELVSFANAQASPQGLIVQANYNDSAQALPEEYVREELGKVFESNVFFTVARDGEGVWEPFVAAVSAGTARARLAQRTQGVLPSITPTSPEELLVEMAERAEPETNEWSTPDGDASS